MCFFIHVESLHAIKCEFGNLAEEERERIREGGSVRNLEGHDRQKLFISSAFGSSIGDIDLLLINVFQTVMSAFFFFQFEKYLNK